ncbi:MAG TPA: hypothetical protein VFL27_15740 [Candidatus Dormibacteraeota bacterium]|nr:hypothetical protein [Candidatus Dormibacteraeota bacterium]
MSFGPTGLLILGAATVGVLHSILPDHWVPLAVVARTQRWSTLRLARTSFLAGAGHVLTSIVLGGAVAVIGLQFQRQIETQQGHIVGGVLIVTGAGFLIWGLTGHGHAHEHGPRSITPRDADDGGHHHAHEAGVMAAQEHVHEHAHGDLRHSHRHSHEEFIRARADLIVDRSSRGTLVGHLGAIAVPFGVAASPDLTFLPFAIAASGFGVGSVAAVLGAFSGVTLVTFVGLTVIATAAGYQFRGEWLEKNANTITSLVLIGIGAVAYIGF